MGTCLLGIGAFAKTLVEALHYFNRQKYLLRAWVVMPNHVHILIHREADLGEIVTSWKTSVSRFASTREAELLFGAPLPNPLWQREYFDRLIRDEEHFIKVKNYIHQNPVRAGLSTTPESFKWSSARSAE